MRTLGPRLRLESSEEVDLSAPLGEVHPVPSDYDGRVGVGSGASYVDHVTARLELNGVAQRQSFGPRNRRLDFAEF